MCLFDVLGMRFNNQVSLWCVQGTAGTNPTDSTFNFNRLWILLIWRELQLASHRKQQYRCHSEDTLLLISVLSKVYVYRALREAQNWILVFEIKVWIEWSPTINDPKKVMTKIKSHFPISYFRCFWVWDTDVTSSGSYRRRTDICVEKLKQKYWFNSSKSNRVQALKCTQT